VFSCLFFVVDPLALEVPWPRLSTVGGRRESSPVVLRCVWLGAGVTREAERQKGRVNHEGTKDTKERQEAERRKGRKAERQKGRVNHEGTKDTKERQEAERRKGRKAERQKGRVNHEGTKDTKERQEAERRKGRKAE
jgi:hypothetical protein